MKQFIKNQKVTYNLMSFTGYKALLIFNLLTEGPKSYAEISDYIFNHPYLREKISIDTFRVYMNSLKRFGCEVKRIKGDDKISRYYISEHPFELKFTQEEQRSLTTVFKSIVKNMTVEELLAMDNFFEKLNKYLKKDDFAANLRKYSPLKDVDKKILKGLLDCCNRQDQIVITYNSPNSGEKHIEIISEKIEISNDKIYLCGTGLEYMQYGAFLVSRVKNIDEIKFQHTQTTHLEKIKIKYELNDNNIELNDNEKILEQSNGKIVVEMTTSNEFFAKQRILEFGPKCKILEPEDFKEKFVQLLKDMKAGYYCG